MHEDRWSVMREGKLVIVVEPDGTRVEADTDELALAHITTNDSGPIGADVWWVLEDAGEIILCGWPQGASGESDVIDWLVKLPGFDHEAMIRAMSSTDNADFVVWRRV